MYEVQKSNLLIAYLWEQPIKLRLSKDISKLLCSIFFFFHQNFVYSSFYFLGWVCIFFVFFQLVEDQNVSSNISFVHFKDIQAYDSYILHLMCKNQLLFLFYMAITQLHYHLCCIRSGNTTKIIPLELKKLKKWLLGEGVKLPKFKQRVFFWRFGA